MHGGEEKSQQVVLYCTSSASDDYHDLLRGAQVFGFCGWCVRFPVCYLQHNRSNDESERKPCVWKQTVVALSHDRITVIFF